MKSSIQHRAEALRAYADYESHLTGRHLAVGCYLVMALMPAGVILDYFVYPDHVGHFLILRLVCSLLAFMVWAFLRVPASQKFHHWLGLYVALLPVFFICWMIYKTEGPASPYYAGLNLSLLAIAFIMRWSVSLSVIASVSVLAIYLGACLLHAHGSIPKAQQGVFANNLYFLVLTSIIVVVGSRLHRELRVREFTVRYELDQRKRELEEAIRKLTEAEAQLVQSEKMASLGRMSAGIIHEINNPLNFATTGLFTLRNKARLLKPEDQAEYTEILTDVEEGIKRVKNIVSDLRIFTHPDTESREEVDVEEVVNSALRFLSNEWRDKVRVEQAIAPNQLVCANKNKLIHVMINLLQNSFDALKRKQFNGEQPTIRIEGHAENGKSCIVVRDNGPGIEPGVVDKIFDPFFTTKEVGEGMGLGLSICYRIVQEYGGRIAVKSEPGKFCEFTLEFPMSESCKEDGPGHKTPAPETQIS